MLVQRLVCAYVYMYEHMTQYLWMLMDKNVCIRVTTGCKVWEWIH